MVMWTTHSKRRMPKRSNRPAQATRASTTSAMMRRWCQWTIWATSASARIAFRWINPIKPIMPSRQVSWALPFLNHRIHKMAWWTLCKHRSSKDSNSNCRIKPVWLVIIKCNRPFSPWWRLFKARRLPYWKGWTLKAKARKPPIKVSPRKWWSEPKQVSTTIKIRRKMIWIIWHTQMITRK